MAHRAYDHVVFDLDGTLVDSRVDLAAAINHVLGRLRLPVLPLETICDYIGEGARRLVQRSLGAAHEDHLDKALAFFFEYYGAHLLDHTRPYPGVPEALTALRARGVQLSVLSNKPEAMSRAILAGLGLLPCFTTVLGGDSLPARKPDPMGIRHVCELTGTAPERMLFVGDSRVDLDTARAAGVAFCGVTWGIRPQEVRAPAVRHVIHEPKELIDAVERGTKKKVGVVHDQRICRPHSRSRSRKPNL